MTCTAAHVVTSADISAKVVVNQAHATALLMVSLELICPLLTANGGQCTNQSSVSTESNTVVLNRAAVLPRTGGTVVDKVIIGGGLSILGALLMVPGRRRRRLHRR
jgi:LPXTG-motif cell wall-anchored protein